MVGRILLRLSKDQDILDNRLALTLTQVPQILYTYYPNLISFNSFLTVSVPLLERSRLSSTYFHYLGLSWAL